MKIANDYLFDWNQNNNNYSNVGIEDDTLRDGLQGAFLKKPSLDQKLELLENSAEIGIEDAMIGFPAASSDEFNDCLHLIKELDNKQISLNLYFLARAITSDLEPIVRLKNHTSRYVCADFFIGLSRLRAVVENWNFDTLLEKCEAAATFMNKEGAAFSISLEDVTRANPEDINKVIQLAVEKKAERITICDTVGALLPQGTSRIIAFVKQQMQKYTHKPRLGWHGHNDNGLALANSIAAIDEGVDFISGAFAGIGERSGNVSLEQIIYFLYQHGNRQYKIDKVISHCQKLAEYTEYSIPSNAPLIGSQVFSTSTGTHCSAIIKAKKMGIDFEDYIFSSVPASKLMREQDIYINYNSGSSNVAYILEMLGVKINQMNIDKILNHAKKARQNIMKNEIQEILGGAII